MQPLGGKPGRRTDKARGRWDRNPDKEEGRRSGIALSLSGRWLRLSRPRRRAAGAWRITAALVMSAAMFYGLAAGGYLQSTADHFIRQFGSMVAQAGFSVRQLTIEGQIRAEDTVILNALGIDRNTSMLSFDTAAAQDRLEQLPWVHRAQVMRLLPSRLHVVIEERRPFAIWQHKGSMHLVDREGAVITQVARSAYPDLPLVVGEGAAAHAKDLFALLEGQPAFSERVRAAIRVADRRWNLQLANGVEIRLPETNAQRALEKITRLDARHRFLSGGALAIDLRLPGRVTVRLSEETAKRRDSAFARSERRRPRPGQET